MDDVRDADPLFQTVAEALLENMANLEKFIEWAKNTPNQVIQNLQPIRSNDSQFLCSDQFLSKCIELFKETSEKTAIERVKRGKKPPSVELAMQKKQSSAAEGSKDQAGPGKKKGKGKG